MKFHPQRAELHPGLAGRVARLVQRVLEMETYRMAALLGLPVAREAGALLARGESERISRMSNLLRTRVEIEQQQSSQALLATMNQRQDLQLKWQTTVEGLSVAAITYYVTGLIGYLAKGAGKLGWPFSVEATVAVAVPVVALTVWWSLRRLHHKLWKAPA